MPMVACEPAGGRVLAAVAQGHDFDEAFAKAYMGVWQTGELTQACNYRRDIGHQVRRL